MSRQGLVYSAQKVDLEEASLNLPKLGSNLAANSRGTILAAMTLGVLSD